MRISLVVIKTHFDLILTNNIFTTNILPVSTPTPVSATTDAILEAGEALTLNGLIEAMFPGLEPGDADRERYWNAVRVLAQKGAIVPAEEVAGSGRHRRYDPLWVTIARALLLLKYQYRLHTDVLVDMGQYAWANRDMLMNCSDIVLVYGEFYDEQSDDWGMNYMLMSSSDPHNPIYPDPDSGQSHGVRHCITVAIDQA